MKKFSLLSSLIFTFVLSTSVFSQAPPPPPGGEHGQNTNQPPNGGGADLGSGLLILTMLGSAYGIKKWRKVNKSEE